jgi:hypothetical protein
MTLGTPMAEEKISLPEPKPPTIIKYSDAEDLIQGATDAEILAFTMLSEAKGTGDDSLAAIGHTILNRKESDLYNFSQQDSIKDVVRQKTSSGDYEYNGLENEIKKGEKVYTPFENTREYIINNPKEYKKVLEIAKNLISMSPENREEADPTMGATFFQNPKTRTNTFIDQKANTGEFIKTKSFGGHDFYSAPFGGPPPPLPSVIPESPPKGRKTKFNDPDKNFVEQMSSAQAEAEKRQSTIDLKELVKQSKQDEKINLLDSFSSTTKEIFNRTTDYFFGDDDMDENPAQTALEKLNKIRVGGHMPKSLSISGGVNPSPVKKARGGMAEQMSMFDEGGLLDEGGGVDPVSGNDVPSGSLENEVRDDIPAQLSEGEFVFPADVVRYIGLEKLMQLRQDAKRGLKLMEEMGQMGNSEEATIPDDIPFNVDDLEVEDMSMPLAFQEGGAVTAQSSLPSYMQAVEDFNRRPSYQTDSSFYSAKDIPSITEVPTFEAPEEMPTFDDLIPTKTGRYDELVKFENKDTGEVRFIPFVDGEPIYPIDDLLEAGFVRVEDEEVEDDLEIGVDPIKAPSVRDTSDGDADERRRKEEEEMYGPGGGRLGVAGDIYGVSFNAPEGFMPGVMGSLSIVGGLFSGKGLPEGATATIKRDDLEFTVTADEYNKLKTTIEKEGANSEAAETTFKEIREAALEKKAEKELAQAEAARKAKLDAAAKAAAASTEAARKAAKEEQRRQEQAEQERLRQLSETNINRLYGDSSDRDERQQERVERQREADSFTREAVRDVADRVSSGRGFAEGGLAAKKKPKAKKQMKRGGLASKK